MDDSDDNDGGANVDVASSHQPRDEIWIFMIELLPKVDHSNGHSSSSTTTTTTPTLQQPSKRRTHNPDIVVANGVPLSRPLPSSVKRAKHQPPNGAVGKNDDANEAMATNGFESTVNNDDQDDEGIDGNDDDADEESTSMMPRPPSPSPRSATKPSKRAHGPPLPPPPNKTKRHPHTDVYYSRDPINAVRQFNGLGILSKFDLDAMAQLQQQYMTTLMEAVPTAVATTTTITTTTTSPMASDSNIDNAKEDSSSNNNRFHPSLTLAQAIAWPSTDALPTNGNSSSSSNNATSSRAETPALTSTTTTTTSSRPRVTRHTNRLDEALSISSGEGLGSVGAMASALEQAMHMQHLTLATAATANNTNSGAGAAVDPSSTSMTNQKSGSATVARRSASRLTKVVEKRSRASTTASLTTSVGGVAAAAAASATAAASLHDVFYAAYTHDGTICRTGKRRTLRYRLCMVIGPVDNEMAARAVALLWNKPSRGVMPRAMWGELIAKRFQLEKYGDYDAIVEYATQ